jgi:3-methyladenine DNA glycosylase/8-oxoguanine DNA glycosylase
MVSALLAPVGPYRLRLMVKSGHWRAPLENDRWAEARQRPDGVVEIRAADELGVDEARFMLALDDDTGPFHERFARDPLLGASARALVGYRPLRLATVAHAALRAVCGQLIEARRAWAIERAILRACGTEVVTRDHLVAFGAADLRRLGLAQHRATALLRLARSVDLEGLRAHPTELVLRRLTAERGLGPWSVGVVALEGLGRYDHGLVGDLGLVKLQSALTGRPVEGWETAALLEPYGEWQGLAGAVLMRGAALGLVLGASPDAARLARRKARRAA